MNFLSILYVSLEINPPKNSHSYSLEKNLITEESLIPALFSPRNKDFHDIYIPSSMYSIVIGTTNDNLSFTSHSTAYTLNKTILFVTH